MTDKQKLNKYLKIIKELKDKTVRLEMAIAYLRSDVYQKYQSSIKYDSCECNASWYASVIDLIDTTMRENNIQKL